MAISALRPWPGAATSGDSSSSSPPILVPQPPPQSRRSSRLGRWLETLRCLPLNAQARLPIGLFLAIARGQPPGAIPRPPARLHPVDPHSRSIPTAFRAVLLGSSRSAGQPTACNFKIRCPLGLPRADRGESSHLLPGWPHLLARCLPMSQPCAPQTAGE